MIQMIFFHLTEIYHFFLNKLISVRKFTDSKAIASELSDRCNTKSAVSELNLS